MDENIYMITSVTEGVTSTNNPYVRCNGVNCKGEKLNFSVWSGNKNLVKVGYFISRNNLKMKSDFYSCAFQELNFVNVSASEADQFKSFFRTVPTRQEWDACLTEAIGLVENPKYAQFIIKNADLYDNFKDTPAGIMMHHDFPGGLVLHIMQMLNYFIGIYPRLTYPVIPEFCIIGILFHDAMKVLEYHEGAAVEYRSLIGHMYGSANMLQNRLTAEGFSKEDIRYIVHIVLSHHGKIEWGSPVNPATNEAVLVHHIDMISGLLDHMNEKVHMEKSHWTNTNLIKYEDFINNSK